jgi:hypothetical protein
MNIKPGAYREPLTAGLTAIGEDEYAKQVADQRIKLAIAGSIRGNVVSRSELTKRFIEALRTKFARNSADEGVADHYINNLSNGSAIPVENISEGGNRSYAPGELFFKT